MHQNGTSQPAAFVPESPKESVTNPLDVAAMFDGARLLVLGGTGFLGKLFWIMLLDRYPGVGKIFLLVRSNKKQTSEERFWSEVATSEAMFTLREKYGDGFNDFLREKIVPIGGDVSLPRCGIDVAFLAREKGTIDAVVNVAGVVDFNPPLDEALDTNAFGTQNLVELARALGDAPLFHTSTCYTVGNRDGVIMEDRPGTYPFPRAGELDPNLWSPEREIADCLDLIAQARHRCEDAFRQSTFREIAKKNLLRRGEPTEGEALDQELASVKRKFVSDRLVEAGLERAEHWGWPNIYTYTKSIGEQIIANAGIPYVITRPACCESTQEFPFPGWNEGIGTSAPIIFMAMKGQHQIIGSKAILDFIPSDQVCVGMILALAELLEGTNKPVYQLGTSDTASITMDRLAELTGIYKRKYFLRTNKGNPFLNFLQAHMEPVTVSMERWDLVGSGQISKAAQMVADVLKMAPGPAAKFARPAASSLEKLSYQAKKIDEIQRLFAPFTYYQKGPFSCANTRFAFSRLSDADRAKLEWKPEQTDWSHYFMNQHLPAMEKRIIPWLEERWKRDVKPLRAHETLATLVDQMAERHAHSLAFQMLQEDGLSRVTYADVLARTNAVARRLIAKGVKKGDRVVLAAVSTPEWPIAYFGIVRAGAVVVPVDRDLESVQFANIVRESEAKLALWDAHVEKKGGAGVRAAIPELTVLDLASITEPDDDTTPLGVHVEPEDIASLIFTSGTTGKPKGVMLSHKNFASLIAALAPLFPLGPNDRVLSVLPLHHTFEFSCGFLLPFSRGARVVYIGDLTGDRVTSGLKEGRITAMVGVPAVWQLLERRILSDVRARGKFAETAFHFGTDFNTWMNRTIGLDLGRLLFGQVHDGLGGHIKWLISGGAALPKETQQLFSGLGLKLTEGYGLTEAGPVLTVAKPGSKAGQVGKPIPGVEIKIDTPDANGVGEVLARGPNVMSGYTDEEATKSVLGGDGWLHTGDLGKLDKQGRLVIAGRSKDVVVTSSGENLYPDDLEKLTGSVRHITEYSFIGISAHGGGERLACLAVPETDDSVDRTTRMARAERHLREALGKLPTGKQPSVVKLYDAPLPRTATRKVKRTEARAIIERLVAASTRDTSAEAGNGQSAAGHVRHAIAAVRGVSPDSIHAGSTLTEDLGFDSLALTELLAALETKYGTIDPNELQNCRTVSDVESLASRDKHESRTRSIEGRAKPKVEIPVLELPREVQDAGKKAIGKLQDFFYGQMMDSEIYGRTFIPHNRQTIVIANHASHLDMGFVRHALGTYGEDIVTLAAQDYFFDRGSLKRTFFENLTNLKALDRKAGLRASERQASEVLEQGRTMLIFPEGTRSPDGDVHEFKPLLGHLALANGVDILPVYLGGTRDAMPKGARLPTSRRIFARVGPPLCVADLRRLTVGLTPADASREVAKLARRAVIALRDGDVLDIAKLEALGPVSVPPPKKREHPLVELFQELETKFDKAKVEKPVSFYFTLGSDTHAKWTVLCDREKCDIRQGKPEGGTADCVLKTSPEIFTRIVRDQFVPGPAEFISGQIKSNDIELLLTFQKIFAL